MELIKEFVFTVGPLPILSVADVNEVLEKPPTHYQILQQNNITLDKKIKGLVMTNNEIKKKIDDLEQSQIVNFVVNKLSLM
jgi:hypothetical protein